MNLEALYPIVSQLQVTASSTEKLRILKENESNQDLRWFFKYSLDSKVIFWITAPLTHPTSGLGVSLDEQVLAQFMHRLVTGNAAKCFMSSLMDMLTPNSQELLRRMFNKDPKCGVAESTVNKIWPGLVSVFEPMKGESVDDYAECIEDLDPSLIIGRQASIKLDGRRVVIFKRGKAVTFLSSNGKPVFNLDEAIPEVLALPEEDLVLDAEFFDQNWNSSSSISSSSKTKKTSDTWRLRVFDYLTMDEWEGKGVFPFHMRDELIKSRLANGVRVVRAEDLGIVQSLAHLRELFDKAVAMGFEGLMLKNLNYIYKCDRTVDWIKAKPVETIDARVVAIEAGKAGGKYANTFGAFVCVDKHGTKFNCGIGLKGSLSDAVRTELWVKQGELIDTFVEIVQDRLPDRKAIASRFPRFLKLRPDKSTF